MTIKPEIRKQIAERYVSGNETQEQVAKEFGVHRDLVFKILNEFRIPIRKYTGDRSMVRRSVFFDFDFFDRRDGTTAYWAGFFLADGHMSISPTGGATLVCYVAKKDIDHMQRFLDDINYSKSMVFRKDGSIGFDIHYAKFKEQLPPWGIAPNKSKFFHTPTCLTAELLPHFLRGWIDGDGSVYRHGQSARVSVSSGNKESLIWFANALRFIGYEGNIGIKEAGDKKYPGNYVLYIGGRNQTARIADLLLVDTCFCMDRKWKTSFYENKGQMFEHVCEVCGNTFLVPKYRHEKEPENGRFCSRDCFNAYQKL